MAQPYVGEIRIFAGNFAPSGWEFCNGQLLSIATDSALFNLIGTTYGGDGQTTFGLPNLQGRFPIHQGGSYVQGALGGAATVTLTTQQIPSHTHTVAASNNGVSDLAINNYFAASPSGKPYASTPSTVNMNSASIEPAGGSLPHDNMIPYVAVSFIISLYGIFPSQ